MPPGSTKAASFPAIPSLKRSAPAHLPNRSGLSALIEFSGYNYLKTASVSVSFGLTLINSILLGSYKFGGGLSVFGKGSPRTFNDFGYDIIFDVRDGVTRAGNFKRANNR